MLKKFMKILVLPAAVLGAAAGTFIMAEKALLKDRDIKVVDAAIKEKIPEVEEITENENTEEES